MKKPPWPTGPAAIKIRDELDLAYELWGAAANDPECDYAEQDALQYRAQGIACALGVLRGTSEDIEWKAAEERFKKQ